MGALTAADAIPGERAGGSGDESDVGDVGAMWLYLVSAFFIIATFREGPNGRNFRNISAMAQLLA